ncbi:dolichyl-diphosphooligosaccharide--protein glycosyltransferase subunit 2 isoform X2 [Beta vulgaris subsp. vulgaris]|uniref:dolichyl-diphosphooligosaccharide--protein glycosyltransferase subunit 2 isoform X2 n=1 Tax=Beta vulgaris subsp. vulgaris TaxID=3555 RepID=UPI002036863C|nr:dolichyl-diphosphooligosaccharide--protein glycosyltransferase subunit 2 isoform X2 [Beta vulgaris subsp. vulgaris]
MGRYKQVGRSRFEVYVTGEIKVENVEIAILDTDLGNVEPPKKLNLSAESSVSLLANHLQKLRLSFQLVSPLGNAFEPNQDFLGLMDKLYYLSGKYNLQLIVGDAVMENSFLCSLGHIDLDLPKVPNKATRPPPQPTDPLLRFAPKPEITHIFRAAEKCALMKLYLAFLVLVLVPLAGFLIGLCRLGVNLMNFPASRVAATYAVLFHVGIAAILCFYVLFWLQLNIFTMLRILFFLGIFVVYVGHKTLSKLKFS